MAGEPPTSRIIAPNRHKFSPVYKQTAFSIWYSRGKIPAHDLYNLLESEDGFLPSHNTVQNWITDEFVPQGEALDLQVKTAMDQRLIQERIKMLEEHTKLAHTMQEMGLEYLEANRETLKVPNAVRLLIEGVRIERESRGIPAMLEKMSNRSDEELLNELKEIVAKAPVTVEAIEESGE